MAELGWLAAAEIDGDVDTSGCDAVDVVTATDGPDEAPADRSLGTTGGVSGVVVAFDGSLGNGVQVGSPFCDNGRGFSGTGPGLRIGIGGAVGTGARLNGVGAVASAPTAMAVKDSFSAPSTSTRVVGLSNTSGNAAAATLSLGCVPCVSGDVSSSEACDARRSLKLVGNLGKTCTPTRHISSRARCAAALRLRREIIPVPRLRAGNAYNIGCLRITCATIRRGRLHWFSADSTTVHRLWQQM